MSINGNWQINIPTLQALARLMKIFNVIYN